MATVSCVIITTLVVVSLANLLLLVHVIMHSVQKCGQSRSIFNKISKVKKREDSISEVKSEHPFQFLRALVVVFEEENFEFICGVAVISKKWVLTAAHCAEPVLDEPTEKLKISSTNQKLKYGFWLDVDRIIVHEKFQSSVGNNVALIKIIQNFKEKDASFVALPKRAFKYMANTTGVAVGWSLSTLYSTDVKLLLHKKCESNYLYQIDDGLFCTEKNFCNYDFGGFLLQKGVLVGVTAFGVGCGHQPIVYTKIAMFEDWISDRKVSAIFKT